MKFISPILTVLKKLQVVAIPVLVIGATAFLGVLFHVRGQQAVEKQLRERMLSTVSIAALQFNADEITSIRSEEDVHTEVYESVVNKLKMVRLLSPHVRFVYIMRRTFNPMELAFVADADGLSANQELDKNNNGTVDENEEPGMPGDIYPIGDSVALVKEAFLDATVEQEVTVDQWGQLISAYAPIKDGQGNTVAIIGMDIAADEYFAVTQNTFSIVAVLLVVLLGGLLAAYILMIIRLRNVESLKQLETERTALLDLATHQLGMPLATFRWWLEILRDMDNGKFCEGKDVCDQLQIGIDRMDYIIKALKDASDLQNDLVNYKPGKTTIETVTPGVIKEVAALNPTKSPMIRMDFEQNLPPVNITQKLFCGMIRELIENAVGYSPKGSEIVVQARKMPNGIEIQVQDHGCGIPKEDLPFIFEKFRRAKNATTYKPVGNGLGLFIVKRIIDKAHGRIRINSVLNQGTTMNIFLPFAS